MVVKDHDDNIVFPEVIFELQEARHRGAGRVAGKDPLFASDPPRHDRRVLVGHLFEVIDDIEIDVPGEEILANPFGDVGIDLVLVEDARLFVFLEHRAVGIDAPHFDFRVPLLQVPAHPGDRAARPDADDEVRHLPVGLIPDFGTGLLVVGCGVREVVVLIRLPGVRHLLLEAR